MAETPAAGDDNREDGCRGSRTRATVARRLTVAVALCLEVSATLLMTTRLLFGATAGIGLASMGWYISGHLPAPVPRAAPAGPGRRKHGTSPRGHTGFGFASSTSPEPTASEGPLSGPDQVAAPAEDPRL